MLELITANESLPFSVAIAVMLGIALLEGITTVLGAGISGFLDSLLPEFDLGADMELDVDGDFDMDGHASPASSFSKVLSWLHVGEVPVLMLVLIMLTAYSLIGWGIQYVVKGATGSFMAASVASIPALLLSFPVVRFLVNFWRNICPKTKPLQYPKKVLLVWMQ
ncbi:MAG: YqiJ family protein [Gammaproteobacteria bacterium]|nr:YqiJ family protein [Gammaproteobacteria bacterium]